MKIRIPIKSQNQMHSTSFMFLFLLLIFFVLHHANTCNLAIDNGSSTPPFLSFIKHPLSHPLQKTKKKTMYFPKYYTKLCKICKHITRLGSCVKILEICFLAKNKKTNSRNLVHKKSRGREKMRMAIHPYERPIDPYKHAHVIILDGDIWPLT
jgi:hypothetical protein